VMQRPQILQPRARLLPLLPKDAEQVGRWSDRIQKLAKHNSELVRLCDFNQAAKLRRLIALPPPAWTKKEALWAQDALDQIESLREKPGPAAALALACFGIERDDLKEAIAMLEDAREKAKEPAASPPKAPEAEAKLPKKPKEKQKAKPQAEPDDEELDPKTQAELDALKAEVERMQKR
jgi:hypothetical protein